MPRALLLSTLLALGATAAYSVELTLGPRALAEAVDIGQSRIESVRERFHRPYRIAVSRPPVDYIEVVTPFRRVALAAEARARAGDRSFGQREARATLGDTPEQIDLLVELTFHPQNTFVGVPDYEVRLVGAGRASGAGGVGGVVVEPRSVTRVPRFGPRVDGAGLVYPYPIAPPVAPGSQPLTGGTLIVALDGRVLDPKGSYDVLVVDAGKDIAKARIDFAGLR